MVTGKPVVWYYRNLVYSNMANKEIRWKEYGEGTMSVPVQRFPKWAVSIPDNMKGGPGTVPTM